jgi:hypothetical protein
MAARGDQDGGVLIEICRDPQGDDDLGTKVFDGELSLCSSRLVIGTSLVGEACRSGHRKHRMGAVEGLCPAACETFFPKIKGNFREVHAMGRVPGTSETSPVPQVRFPGGAL